MSLLMKATTQNKNEATLDKENCTLIVNLAHMGQNFMEDSMKPAISYNLKKSFLRMKDDE